MTMSAAYPTAVYLAANVSGTGLQPGILDNSKTLTPQIPMIVQVVVSATATVQILGALEVTTLGVLINPQDVTGGGFTSSNFYDLISGLPFYQVNITANTGTVTVKVGTGATGQGDLGKPNLLTFTTNATQGM